jgi:hypothetical protein
MVFQLVLELTATSPPLLNAQACLRPQLQLQPRSRKLPQSKRVPTAEQISTDSSMSSAELSAIRSRYLGVDKKKRQIRKMSDRKFVFDWSEQDDTFSSDSPSAVGGARQGAAVMFGRGHLAGMDPDAAHATMASGVDSAVEIGRKESLTSVIGRKSLSPR